MPTSGQHNSGPAGVKAPSYPSGGEAPACRRAPPRYKHYKSKRVVAGCITSIADVDERHPLLSQPKHDARPEASCSSLLVILCISFLLCPLFYFIIPGSSDAVDYKSLYQVATARIQHLSTHNLALEKNVTRYKDMYEDICVRAAHLDQENTALEGEIQGLQTKLHGLQEQVAFYKDMYEDVRARAVHLEQENAALERKMHDLQNKLHDLREQLTNSKVLAFWEIARTMYTNMDVWVGADDPGGGPKFWSYGITSGLFNDNDPPVTSTKFHFADNQAAIIESTEHRRVVGYKVESNRWNNGWWIATGLMEFGQSGSHEVRFGAKSANNGAEYEVTVFFADWKL